ncbi:hypothetical protein V7S43_004439 [Phytophthora oleae]|uniref:Uncharacterized protein n=1 Tax=Phytophthora oleae TaxID=2107226 RepID=A0ABD3FV63_9STRA
MATQVTPTPAPTESTVPPIGTSDHKNESAFEEYSALELYGKLTLAQKVIIGVLCALIALEGLYLYAIVVEYLAEWFILLLAATKRMKQLRSEP